MKSRALVAVVASVIAFWIVLFVILWLTQPVHQAAPPPGL